MRPCPVCGERSREGDVFYLDRELGGWLHGSCAEKEKRRGEERKANVFGLGGAVMGSDDRLMGSKERLRSCTNKKCGCLQVLMMPGGKMGKIYRDSKVPLIWYCAFCRQEDRA